MPVADLSVGRRPAGRSGTGTAQERGYRPSWRFRRGEGLSLPDLSRPTWREQESQRPQHPPRSASMSVLCPVGPTVICYGCSFMRRCGSPRMLWSAHASYLDYRAVRRVT